MAIYTHARQVTQNRIRKAFWTLYKERPINKITVNELSATCQVHRNTFYFYYHDVYSILEEIEQHLLSTLDRFDQLFAESDGGMLAFSHILYECFQNDIDYLRTLVYQRKDYNFAVKYVERLKEKLLSLVSGANIAHNSTKQTYLLDMMATVIIFTLIQGIAEAKLSLAEVNQLIAGFITKGYFSTLQTDFHVQGLNIPFQSRNANA